jgi:hypothetical protein
MIEFRFDILLVAVLAILRAPSAAGPEWGARVPFRS